MSETFKKLASGTSPDGSTYTVPSLTSAVISNITVSNSDPAAQKFSVYVHGNVDPATYDDSNALYYEAYLPANSSTILEPGVVLDAGKTMKIDVHTSNMSASIFGSEIDPPQTYSVLGQSKPLATTETDIYENDETGKVALIRSIVLCNVGTEIDYFNIAIVGSADPAIENSDYIAWHFEINPKETVIFSSKYQIEYNNKISGYSENGTTTFSIFGVEI